MGLFGKKKALIAVDKPAIAKAMYNANTVCETGAADDELIAVIAAAISAYEAEQYRQALYISKLNRTAGTRPAWGVTGMNEAIDTRRM